MNEVIEKLREAGVRIPDDLSDTARARLENLKEGEIEELVKVFGDVKKKGVHFSYVDFPNNVQMNGT